MKNALELYYGKKRLSDGYADSWAFSEREGRILADMVNNERMTQRIKDRIGWK